MPKKPIKTLNIDGVTPIDAKLSLHDWTNEWQLLDACQATVSIFTNFPTGLRG